jgi:ABC-type branched-subunit amino acid transport system ATPase component
MTNPMRPTRFAPVHLTMLDVGALRGTTEVPFLDQQGQPTNLFLIMGPNGAGKTTVLDAIFTTMSLLAGRAHPHFGIEALDAGEGGVQLDALVQLDDGVRSELRLLSIIAGRPGLLRSWTKDQLDAVGVQAEPVRLIFQRRSAIGPVELSASSDELAVSFLDAILERLDEPPASLFGTSMALPTLLYFPSDRGIKRPPAEGRTIVRPATFGYRPVHRFGADGEDWSNSIENLLVWFTWLDDDREKRCREIVNDVVFRGAKRLAAVDRQNLMVPVETETGRHRLDQLSSGERQLVQLVVRIAAHMTSSTIVLIDETEQHLHTVMRRRLVNMLKDWARDYEGLSFVMTSHQADSMRLLAPRQVEPRLFKSGCLVKPRFRLPHG